MTEPFPHLFSPLRVGKYTLKNRIMNTGHAAHFQAGNGTPTGRYVHYVTNEPRVGRESCHGHTVPVYDGETFPLVTNFDDRVVQAFQRMAAATHAYDVPLLAQLGHRGAVLPTTKPSSGVTWSRPRRTCSRFLGTDVMPHGLTTAEVGADLWKACSRVPPSRKCELDGIEFSVEMDYLFTNFLHPNGNRRSDKYGGATLDDA